MAATALYRWLPLAAGLALGPAASDASTTCDLEQSTQGCDMAALERTLHINQLQAVGTHNSYKQAMPAEEWVAHHQHDPEGADGLDYAHPALDVQLDRGARTLELDIYYDPQGGHFAHPPGALRRGYATSPWPPAAAAEMTKPGFKVMHLADIDFRSNCQTFVGCLRIIRAWSRAHPDHVPIMLLLNAKDGHGGPGAASPMPFTAAAFDAMDAAIRSVFARGELIEPDDVQGSSPTLRDAVLAGGWPTLAQSRGKVFFVLDEGPGKVAMYRGARHSLEGRVAFINTDESSPAAAYLTLNDPLTQRERIRGDVAAGFMVRTRADADTREARRHDTRRRDAALASGAQYVSTDYMVPDTRFGAYRVALPDAAVARCSPVVPVAACSPQGKP